MHQSDVTVLYCPLISCDFWPLSLWLLSLRFGGSGFVGWPLFVCTPLVFFGSSCLGGSITQWITFLASLFRFASSSVAINLLRSRSSAIFNRSFWFSSYDNLFVIPLYGGLRGLPTVKWSESPELSEHESEKGSEVSDDLSEPARCLSKSERWKLVGKV